jgi:hypothetical protein
MNEREYLRFKNEIEAEAKRKLDALEIVWKMARSSPSRKTPANSSSGAGTRKGKLILTVKETVDIMPAGHQFSLDDLIKAQPSLANERRSSVNTALTRLPNVKLFSSGKGRKSAIFKKA